MILKKTILLLMFTSYVFGNQEIKEEKENLNLLEQSIIYSADFQKYMSKKISNYSSNIDNFLSNDYKPYKHNNKSYINIAYAMEKPKDDKFNTYFELSGKLKLHKLQDKLHFEFTNENKGNEDNNLNRLDSDESKNKKIFAGFSYIEKFKDIFTYKASLGLKLDNNLESYLKLNVKYETILSDYLDVKAIQNSQLFMNKGYQSTSSIEFYKQLDKNFVLSNYNEYFWEEKVRNDNFYNNIKLHQRFDKRNHIQYIVSVYSDNDDSKDILVKDYQTYIEYKHKFNHWSYVSVIPKVIWHREDDFDPSFTFLMKLGMKFGL